MPERECFSHPEPRQTSPRATSFLVSASPKPFTSTQDRVRYLLDLIDEIRLRYEIPTQSCVLTHVSTTIDLMDQGAPVDLVFQSIAGTEGTLKSFGVTPSMLAKAKQAADELSPGTVGTNTMYFEIGQGSCFSTNAHMTQIWSAAGPADARGSRLWAGAPLRSIPH